MTNAITYQLASTGDGARKQDGDTWRAERLDLTNTVALVIEDEAMIAWSLESLLEELGFATVALAPSGEDAVAAALASSPGLIVSDINLGAGMDGIAAVATIIQSSAVPVIFVSGYANDEARSRISQEVPGAVILAKPVQPEELRRTVVSVMQAGSMH